MTYEKAVGDPLAYQKKVGPVGKGKGLIPDKASSSTFIMSLKISLVDNL
uniref:Uncharacterized protein n=1 Tax=Medicago truncatula TaxID=3880 RepID=A2Q5F0_MEDTR|nr:hypothetical protein MtrDRAFT_AC161399g43v2 [Medicago truncatula]